MIAPFSCRMAWDQQEGLKGIIGKTLTEEDCHKLDVTD